MIGRLLSLLLLVLPLHAERYPVFVYGSLLNPESAKTTLSSETVAAGRPAVAFGIRRLFNRKVAEELVVKRFGPLEAPDQVGALNVVWTGRPTDRVNGLLLQVTEEELARLKEREVGYGLISVKVAPWEGSLCRCWTAYTFSAGGPYVASDVMPIPGYYEEVRKGMARYGRRFLEVYLQTTYLANGVTPIKCIEVSLLQ
ncbi:MAG: gamma-glutamylcyclotransferase family protein [Parachlamydiales bacterium]